MAKKEHASDIDWGQPSDIMQAAPTPADDELDLDWSDDNDDDSDASSSKSGEEDVGEEFKPIEEYVQEDDNAIVDEKANGNGKINV